MHIPATASPLLAPPPTPISPPSLLSLLIGDVAASPYFNGTQPPGGGGRDPKKELQNWSSLIGIITAIVGNVLIALALNVQRYAHLRLHRQRMEVRDRARQALRNAAKQDAGGSNGAGGGYGTLGDTSSDGHADTRWDTEAGETEALLGDHDGDQREIDPRTTRGFRPSGSGGSENSDEDLPPATPDNYLKSPYWWLGQVLITVGEMGNFLAYGFAPASIVSPLGVVALVSNCVIAPLFFKEHFRARDLWGVLVAVAGAVTVVLSASSKETKLAPHDVWDAITSLAFEVYMAVTGALIVLLMWASPRYGNRTILIDLGLVGLFGGYTALSTKGVSSMLSSTLLGAFTTPVTYALLFVLLATAVMQVRYVNKALQRFDSTLVIPIQFVTFTLSVIIGSAVLYRDFKRYTVEQALKFIGGCLLTFFGVFLITSGRPSQDDGDSEADLSDVEGVEETIGLSEQTAGGGDGANRETGPAPATDDEPRSRRSSRVSFMDTVNKPLSVLVDTGIPSMRVPPPKTPQKDNGAATGEAAGSPLTGYPWTESVAAARNSMGARAISADAVLTQTELESAVESEPPTPLQHPPFMPTLLAASPMTASPVPTTTQTSPTLMPTIPDRPVTPRQPHSLPALAPSGSASRPHSHVFQGPLFSPSPLSSTVSAVVGDALLLNGGLDPGSPMTRRRLTARMSRPSLRTSLFVPYDELEHSPQLLLLPTPSSAATTGGAHPNHSVPASVAEDSDVGDSSKGGTGFRGRARSLSNTLGEFFGGRARRRRSTLEGDDDLGEQEQQQQGDWPRLSRTRSDHGGAPY